MSSDSGDGLLVHYVCLAQEAVMEGLHQRLLAAGFENLRSSHDCVFRYLDMGGNRLSDLADRAGMSKQSIGQHIDYLAQRGYLERIPDPSDRRAKLVRPTERGVAVKKASWLAFRDMEEELATALGPEGFQRTREALRTFSNLRGPGMGRIEDRQRANSS